MPAWFHIGPLTDIPPESGQEFTRGDRIVAVFNVNGEIHALDGICPHAGGPLAGGAVNGAIVTCPWHGWQFDVTTGQHCLSSQICQQRFPVRIVNGEIEVELP